MPQFSYRARNAQGGLVEGVLDCPDRSVAIRQIEQLRYIPGRIDIVRTGASAKQAKQGSNGAAIATATATAAAPLETQKLKIPHGQLLVLPEQLGHLLRAGMTLDEGLAILEKRLKQPKMQAMTRTLHQSL